MIDFLTCGDWKRVFLLTLDMKDFIPLANDFAAFYRKFMDLICEEITIQRCAVAQWMGDIRRYFESLVAAPIPLQFSKGYIVNSSQKRFAEQLTEIGNEIRAAWEQETSIDWWITCLFSIALTIPVVLGFSKTMFIIDHIEAAAVRVYPGEKFLRSGPCDIGEHLKYLLQRGDYLFACEKEDDLIQFLMPLDDDGVDLLKRTDFITTYGISTTVTDYDPPLILQLKGDSTQFVIKGSYCDGIPSYISLWNQLNLLVDDFERQRDGSDERTDALYYAIAYAQALLNLLFVPEDKRRARIVNLRRSSRSEGRNLRAEEAKNRLAQVAALESASSVSLSDDDSSN
jgi:hypothetical protein